MRSWNITALAILLSFGAGLWVAPRYEPNVIASPAQPERIIKREVKVVAPCSKLASWNRLSQEASLTFDRLVVQVAEAMFRYDEETARDIVDIAIQNTSARQTMLNNYSAILAECRKGK